MTTAVAICSNALLMLGDKPIASFDEGTDRSRLAANLYPTVRDFVLRSHPWNCAIKRAILSPDSAPPAFEWKCRFALPGDWLRTLSVGDRHSADGYAMEGGYILANTDVCRLRYIHRATEDRWDSMLVHAVTVSMRQAFAYPITTSTSLEQLITQVLQPILQQARSTDGQEEPPEMLGDERLYGAGF